VRKAACVSILWLAASVSSGQDVPIFSSGIEVVRVDVSVLRDGKLVEGLQAGDFEVRDVLLKALEEFRSRVRVRARSGYVEEEDRR